MQNHSHDNVNETEPVGQTTGQAPEVRQVAGDSPELDALRARLDGKTGRQYWKSFEELAGTPEFEKWVEDEFPERKSLMQVDRRRFLTLSGAALAMAGLSGCRILPASKAVPYVRAPEELIPGIKVSYATAVSRGGYATGVVVESFEGRPIKVEGNPGHPASLGSTSVWEQAEILNLYDPDRSQAIASRVKPGDPGDQREEVAWDNALNAIRQALVSRAVNSGAGFALLTETITSPTVAAQVTALLARYPQAKWYQYDPVSRENVLEGSRLAFGRPLNPVYQLRSAKVIVALDSDFLTDSPGSIRYARDFADGRRVRKSNPRMNRLYAVESSYTITGASADHRLGVKPSQVEGFARALYAAVVGGAATPPAGVEAKWFNALVSDLKANSGSAVVIPGEHSSPAVHALAQGINGALGAVGATVVYTEPVEASVTRQAAELKNLVNEMSAGQVQLLAIIGGNPVYNAPADYKFGEAMSKVPLRVRLGLYEDETSALCHYHMPMSHTFEAWSDTRAFDGTVTVVQPLIAPLYDTRSPLEFLALLNGEATPGNELVRGYWQTKAASPSFVGWWERVLRNGIVPNTALPPVPATAKAGLDASLPAAPPAGGKYEINFRPDPSLYDGRYANNSWLQELPKPITTICWDNVAIVSPATAKEIGLIARDSQNDAINIAQYIGKRLAEVKVGGATLKMPVWILPGQPNGTITVHLGFGRTLGGNVCAGVGFDTYTLRTSATMDYAPDATITQTGEKYDVVYTQPHHMMKGSETNPFTGKPVEDKNRDIVRVANIQEYAAKDGHVFPHYHVPHTPEGTGYYSAEAGGGHGAPAAGGDHGGAAAGGAGHAEQPVHGGQGSHSLSASRGNDQGEEIPADRFRQQWKYAERDMSNKEGWPSLYPAYSYKGFNAWAMSIDLTTCIGCNTCTIACQAENNIPTVGKDQVGRGREMHWIRIDHYYATDQDWDNVESFFQPVACVHCETAPCEPVCPVAATVHSHEGLNQMIYNRCIGTRYCSNNCPYKVRRFNFLKWTQGVGGPRTLDYFHKPQLQMLANPDVTVRGRGVMEKCTYCVQRINAVRIEAKKAGREIKDGEIVMACEQACPTKAITFGDINDKNSRVYKLREEPADYSLLADLNTRPRTTYMARLRNPNPEIEVVSASASAGEHGTAGNASPAPGGGAEAAPSATDAVPAAGPALPATAPAVPATSAPPPGPSGPVSPTVSPTPSASPASSPAAPAAGGPVGGR